MHYTLLEKDTRLFGLSVIQEYSDSPFALTQRNTIDLKLCCICRVHQRSKPSLAEEQMSGLLWDLVIKLIVLFGICSALSTDTQRNNMFQQINILYYLLVTI